MSRPLRHTAFRAALRAARLLAALAATASSTAAAQAPVVTKVDPPNWWTGHTINPVRVLVRGRNLAGARLSCGRLACANVRVSAAGTYVFADVRVPAGTAPGRYPLTLRTAGGSAPIPFTVDAPLPAAGRFRGWSPDDVIYLIMPDRFDDGDPANDDPAGAKGLFDRRDPHLYHGGDLAGVRARLPYLKALGVTAVWLNPVYANTHVPDTIETAGGRPTAPYHGYHAVDYYGVEPHFGTLADLRGLVDAAHAVGIKVILDMVANHTSAYHPWVDDPPTPTWYHGTRQYHLANTFQGWTVADPYAPPELKAATLDGWFVNFLPDLNQGDPETARYLTQNSLWWIGATGADGIRQDTWQYVPRAFWHDWMTALNRQYPRLTVVGEVLEGDPALTSFHQGGRVGWDGIDPKVQYMFDFPVYFTLRDAFARGHSIRPVAQMIARDRLYPRPDLLVTLLGSHDERRFMGEPGATVDGLKLAYTFLLTYRGTPMIYYGDEIGMAGGGDPDNRRDFPGGFPGDRRDAFEASGRTPAEQNVFAHVQRLLRLRAERADLRRGATAQLQVGEQTYVYRRGQTVVVLNNDTARAEVRVPGELVPARATADALGICPAPRRDGADVVFAVPARAGCIF